MLSFLPAYFLFVVFSQNAFSLSAIFLVIWVFLGLFGSCTWFTGFSTFLEGIFTEQCGEDGSDNTQV